jgi:polyphenol oxidase
LEQEPLILKTHAGLAWLEAPELARIPWLIHAFTTRSMGTFAPVPSDVRAHGLPPTEPNMKRLFDVLQVKEFATAAVHQIHSSKILQAVRKDQRATYLIAARHSEPGSWTSEPAADGLFTDNPNLLLTVRIADCLPVLLVDPQQRAVAAIHAGWRGTLDCIAEKAVVQLQQTLNVNPCNLIALLGPSIRSCCYEVGSEVADAFRKRFADSDRFFRQETGRHFLDLAIAARSQLEKAGISPERILASNLCTRCRADLFYSFRREGAAAGRMVAAIGMRQ